MTRRLPVLADTTIDELVAQRPEARDALRARGIDTCCGGSLTLRDAAELKGVALADLLGEVGGGDPPVAADDPPVRSTDTVRSILARYPATVAVFEQAGLLGCGGKAGPDEPVDLFAAVHRLDAGALLASLNEAVRKGNAAAQPGAEPVPAESAVEASDPELFRPFLRASLWCTITLGATFGADNLFRIHWATGPLPAEHNWIHAAFQLWGFVFLAIAGVAYHTFPRFVGRSLAAPGLARKTLWFALFGLLITAYSRFGHHVPYPVAATVLGALLQFAAVAGFAWVLHATARGASLAGDPFARALAAGTGWWLVAASLLVAGAVTAVASGDAARAARWNEAVYAAALYGGALSWIQGMLLRTAPMFLGLRPPSLPLAGVAFWSAQCGSLLGVLAGSHLAGTAALALAEAAVLLVAISALAFLFALAPFRAGAESHFAASDPHFRPILNAALGSLALFALLGGSYGALGLLGPTQSQFLFDGARHAFGLGFVTLSIVAMAGRVVPIFSGGALAWPRLRAWGAVLIVTGLLAREVQVLAALWSEPALLRISGLSGFVAALGVTLASISLLRTLAPAATTGAARRDAGDPRDVAIAPATIVFDLVSAHPEAIPILIEAGFTPLANPVLRRTLTRAVSLGQAAAMHKIDLDGVIARIRAACPHGARAAGVPGPPAPERARIS